MPSQKRTEFRSRILTADEGDRLAALTEEHPESTDGFVRSAYKIQHGSDAEPTESALHHANRHLERVIDGKRVLSRAKAAIYAKALGFTRTAFLARISDPSDKISFPLRAIPWIAEEETVCKYRTIFHHYHLAREDDDDFFWVYTPIDFTSPQNGFLYSDNPCGLQGNFKNQVYGYLFTQVLVIIMKSITGRQRMESVHVYYDFCVNPLSPFGNFGVVFSENFDCTKGIAGSLIFPTPFRGTGSAGRQEANLCDDLTEYWRLLDGPRANRILHLFGYGIYERPKNSHKRLEEILRGNIESDVDQERARTIQQSSGSLLLKWPSDSPSDHAEQKTPEND